MEKIKISLADDEPLFRKGISLLLQCNTNIEVVFEAANGKELVSFLEQAKNKPDIIIMDLKMPVLNGVEAIKIIQSSFPGIKVIVLSNFQTKTFVAKMIHLGAASYIVKNTTPQELMNAVYEVYKSGFYYNEYTLNVINTHAKSIPKRTISRFNRHQLTNREVQILKLICRQYSSLEIANKLFLSHRTIEGHKSNLLRKTACKNTMGLIFYALLHDYVSIYTLMDKFNPS